MPPPNPARTSFTVPRMNSCAIAGWTHRIIGTQRLTPAVPQKPVWRFRRRADHQEQDVHFWRLRGLAPSPGYILIRLKYHRWPALRVADPESCRLPDRAFPCRAVHSTARQFAPSPHTRDSDHDNCSFGANQVSTENYFILRGDHHISENDSLSGDVFPRQSQYRHTR